MSVRRALFWTTAERYVGMVLNLVLIVVLSRLLTPREIGIMQLGYIAFTLIEALRDFGVGTYLIQKKDLTLADVHAAFTFKLLFSMLLAVTVFISADSIASFYGEPGLGLYLRVFVATCLIAPLSGIPMSLMRREMAFGKLAFVHIACGLLNVVATTTFALLGYGYMSPAWAAWVWSMGFVVLSLAVRPDLAAFRIRFRGWRSVLSFGGYSVVPQVLQRLYDALPSLVLGRLMSMTALGYFDRAAKVSELPDKIGTIGVQSVALPVFASEVRAGRALNQAYLDGIAHVTAVHWPGLFLLILLAEPIVGVILGPQWNPVVPLVRIIAVAFLANFSQVLGGAALIAAGHVRDTMVIAVLVLPIMAGLFLLASLQSLTVAAVSLIAIGSLRAVVANAFVCRRLQIAASEIARQLARSSVVAATAMVGPLAILALRGFDTHFDVPASVVVGAAAVPGWLIGLRLTAHPLFAEVVRVAQRMKRQARARGAGIGR